jgi:putative ABC transport system permease protein
MNFLNELKIAARSLSRVPALWLTVALTLALGIGANAAIFSVVRGVLLRPLANKDEDRLLYIRQSAIEQDGQYAEEAFSVPEITDVRRDLKTISDVGTFSAVDFTVLGLGEPRSIRAGVVDGNYFNVMGLKPIAGRLLGPSDDGPNAPGAVVLTEHFWRTALHSDPAVLGKTVQLGSYEGNRSATIVGIVEPFVPYPVETEFIANIVTSPHHLSASMVQGRTHRMTEIFARLSPTSDLNAAQAEVRATYGAMTSAHPETYRPDSHWKVDVSRMHDQINSKAKTILWVLFAAAALLFIISVSNVANLVLARTVRRENELAVRSALGATSWTLRRSLLAESLVLCVTGCIAGLAIAGPMVAILARYAARFSPRAEGLKLDGTLVLVGIALSLIAAFFLAFVPRLPSSDSSKGFALTSSGVRIAGGSHRRLRVFAVTQITASFLLLAGAGALMKTLLVLEQTQAPFDTARVLAINLPVLNYGKTPQQVSQFYRDARAHVAAVPGVEYASVGFATPWRYPHASFRPISQDFFNTMGIPLLSGRDFRDTDRADSEPVVIVSESLAKRLLKGADPLNRHISWNDPVLKFIGISDKPRRIVGVVPDFDDTHIIPQPKMIIYQPMDQEGFSSRLFVRSDRDPKALISTITQTIRQVSPDQPVERPATLAEVRAQIVTPDKLNAIVFGGFAAVALLISIVGVAGVLAFSVSGRIREFGIRMALGAQPSAILKNVLFEGALIGIVGVVTGFVAGFALAKLAAKYVEEIQVPSATPLVIAALLILAAAVIAAALPAARASRVDAVEALRAE